MGSSVTRVTAVGVGTTEMQRYDLVHSDKVIRLWDMPGGNDQHGMNEHNLKELEFHLKNEQHVSSVILCNKTGRNLRGSEQESLLL